ncbi:hypothetical protein CEXT_172821 [Caerostris extrusa]|uniref:Uncharacterized protein n=1 Tax=Caerostris extrusa TaxID=172846 RepID=A0AAV4VB76_CAEEX|nr:hypothetical protein CEXT_172821 [Caerostris extrusa]
MRTITLFSNIAYKAMDYNLYLLYIPFHFWHTAASLTSLLQTGTRSIKSQSMEDLSTGPNCCGSPAIELISCPSVIKPIKPTAISLSVPSADQLRHKKHE